MSADLTRRVFALEMRAGNVERKLADALAEIATLKGQLLATRNLPQIPVGGGPGQILWAYATSGISAASVTGSAGAYTLAPASATCDLYSYNAGSNDWEFFQSATVYNDWVNSLGNGIATGHWCLVYQDASGKYRVIGEQC